MIGFNQEGLVKVWINNNFAKNSPDSQQGMRFGSAGKDGVLDEKSMIAQVL